MHFDKNRIIQATFIVAAGLVEYIHFLEVLFQFQLSGTIKYFSSYVMYHSTS